MSENAKSENLSRSSQGDGGVLGNLPRTRPQRSSPRRAAARNADGAKTVARGPRPKGRPRQPVTTRAAPPKRTKTSAGRVGAPTARALPDRARDNAPRQGFESDSDTARGPVQPPGGAELIVSAAEILGELAKSGVAAGERLLKDVISRLPLS